MIGVPETPAEAVERVLLHIEARAKVSRATNSYDGLLAPPDLPLVALEALGTLTRLDDDSAGQDTLPSLLIETTTGQAQIEVCPFGPLVLITSDGDMETDAVAQAFLDAGIAPLFPGDLDDAGEWHGAPLQLWLFPRRLAAVLARFDTVKGQEPLP